MKIYFSFFFSFFAFFCLFFSSLRFIELCFVLFCLFILFCLHFFLYPSIFFLYKVKKIKSFYKNKKPMCLGKQGKEYYFALELFVCMHRQMNVEFIFKSSQQSSDCIVLFVKNFIKKKITTL